MRLILTHEQPDFDALASVALASVLYPGAVGVLGGQLERNVEELLRLYRDQIPLIAGEKVVLEEVEALVLVDTADPRRIGRFRDLIGRVPVTIFDHHPVDEHSVAGAHGVQEAVGASVTLLCRRLEQEGVELPAPLASLALLGLHEDTGDLTFDHVTADDHRAAAYLLRMGANLALLRRFRSAGTGSELHALRDAAIAASPSPPSRRQGTRVASRTSPPTCSTPPAPTPPSCSRGSRGRRCFSRARRRPSTSPARWRPPSRGAAIRAPPSAAARSSPKSSAAGCWPPFPTASAPPTAPPTS